jgi:hypothetical protein
MVQPAILIQSILYLVIYGNTSSVYIADIIILRLHRDGGEQNIFAASGNFLQRAGFALYELVMQGTGYLYNHILPILLMRMEV